MRKEGLSAKKQGFGETWRLGLQPTERQKAIELKLAKESGCILLKLPGKEGRNR